MEKVIETALGRIKGEQDEYSVKYLGIPYATAKRFEYAKIKESLGDFDATHNGTVCKQYRHYFPHLDVPERLFYHNEFRKNLDFEYGEDCLNLNITVPNKEGKFPVLVFVHGGGFNSGSNYEFNNNSTVYARKDVVLVSVNYRVGVFGYFTHGDIAKECGRDGNFGLDDIIVALRWVKRYISEFQGDPDNITLLGQSAGAISIQYLCLSGVAKGLFNRVVMMSGAGKFPDFALPKKSDATHDYWLAVMKEAGAETLDEFRDMPAEKLLEAVENVKLIRKDTLYSTMPVVDGYILEDNVKKLIDKPLDSDCIIGYTNNDMFTAIMAYINHKYARKHPAYIYYFDIDAPGDNNLAFHSSDLRYVFGTLKDSHRPYGDSDYLTSEKLSDYIANFARSGNPNGVGLPTRVKSKHRALCIGKEIKMGRPPVFKLIANTLKGDPK